MVDVNLNGNDYFFALSQAKFVYYQGQGISGTQVFTDTTNLHTVAWGGSGQNLFRAGSGQDDFFGGTGSNTFVAGSGFDLLVGGSGANVFYESATGSGEIMEVGSQNTLYVPPNATGIYLVR
jgi:Ca2+-binding RTX toxin-like protein